MPAGVAQMKHPWRLYGILGHRIGYSLSPVIYNTLFRRHRLPFAYGVFDVQPQRLGEFLNFAELLGVSGFNVTTPHKRAVLPMLGSMDRIATKTKSVNLVLHDHGKWRGYNTDYQGLAATIEDKLKLSVKKIEAVIVGSGGAANTVYTYLANHGAARITLYYRSAQSAARLDDIVSVRRRSVEYIPRELQGRIRDIQRCDLMVNCTPAPIGELADEALLQNCRYIVELRYGTFEPMHPFHINGNYMLAVQAAETFRLISGTEVPVRSIQHIIGAALND